MLFAVVTVKYKHGPRLIAQSFCDTGAVYEISSTSSFNLFKFNRIMQFKHAQSEQESQG